MLTEGAKELLLFIKQAERRERECRVEQPDEYDGPGDDYFEEFYINDLCLMFLVTLYHAVEREVLHLATHVGSQELTPDDVASNRKGLSSLRDRALYQKLNGLLNLSVEGTESMNTLRLLANSYKHDSMRSVSKDLRDHLHLPDNLNYAPMEQSFKLRCALSKNLGVKDSTNFVAITEEFLRRAETYLTSLKQENKARLATIKRSSKGLLNPDNALH